MAGEIKATAFGFDREKALCTLPAVCAPETGEYAIAGCAAGNDWPRKHNFEGSKGWWMGYT